MELLDLLKQRMDMAGQEMAQAQAEFSRAAQRLTALKSNWEAYRNAYNAEAQRTGRQAQVAQSSPAATATPLAPVAANGDMNVTEFIRELIANSANGITAVDIWKKVHEKRSDVARNYIYAVLSRLVSRDFATLREHRYFPVVNR